MKSWPEIPHSALVKWDAEIARDRKNGRLLKLGDSPVEVVSALKWLSRKQWTRAAVQASIVGKLREESRN